MVALASSGKIGFISYLILSNDNDYDVTVTSPTEALEVKCSSLKTAKKIVERKINKIKGIDNESEGYY